jgi:hypothetical protein
LATIIPLRGLEGKVILKAWQRAEKGKPDMVVMELVDPKLNSCQYLEVIASDYIEDVKLKNLKVNIADEADVASKEIDDNK